MSTQTAPSPQAPDGPAEDFARAVLEEQLEGLRELAAIGLGIVRGLGKIVDREAEAAEPDPQFDVVAIERAHDRAARAVRMSYALQQVVLDKLRAVGRIEIDQAEKAERARVAAAQARQELADAPAKARENQIREALEDIIADAHEGDLDAHKRCIREAKERLRDPDVFRDVLGRPASEIIAAICRGLGLEANWRGLAQQAWALEEVRSRNVGKPLKSPPPWTGKGLGRKTPPPAPDAAAPEPPSPLRAPPSVLARAVSIPSETQEAQVPAPPPAKPIDETPPPSYIPPPDPDILPGHACGLPGELPPERPKRRPYWA